MPLLLLLSRLRPSVELQIELDLELTGGSTIVEATGEGSVISGGALVRELIQLVVHCRGQRHHAARAMAARALAALCPSMNAGALAAALADSLLPASEGGSSGASASSEGILPRPSTTNGFHGTMVMVQELTHSAVAAAARASGAAPLTVSNGAKAPQRTKSGPVEALAQLLLALGRSIPPVVGTSHMAPPLRLEALKVFSVLQVRSCGFSCYTDTNKNSMLLLASDEKTKSFITSNVFIRHNAFGCSDNVTATICFN